MTKTGLDTLRKKMCSLGAVSGTLGKRRHMEALYYLHFKEQGVHLRGKYRP
jgi:hypothetical protein